MTALDTLHSLLEAAELGDRTAGFASGGHSIEVRTLESPAEARQALEDALAKGFVRGWVLFDETLVEISGDPSADLPDARFPLAAELAHSDGRQSIRLEQSASGWSLSTLTRAENADGLLETATHRRTGGDEIRHEVAWAPDSSGALRPASARILPPS